MDYLSKILIKDPDYAELLNEINKNRLPTVCTGLSLIHKAVVIKSLLNHTNRKITVITHDEASATELFEDAVSLGINAVTFPLRDYCIGEYSGYSKEYEHKRTDTLTNLLDGDFELAVISVDAACQLTVPPEILARARFNINMGDSYEISSLCEMLLNAGYVRSEICEGKGQFSIRGGIFDVFPVNSDSPYRIEFWGDEIDSISIYDTETQRRTENADSIEITPACEILYNPNDLAEKLKSYSNEAKVLTDKQRERLSIDIAALENGISIHADRYIPLIYEGGETVFDYLRDTLTFVSESGSITERLKSIFIQQSEDVESYLTEGFLSEATSMLWLGTAEFWGELQNAVILENFPRTSYELKIKNIINFNFKRSTAWGGDINVLLEDIGYITEQKGTVVILAGEQRAAKVLTAELNERGINAIFTEKPSVLSSGVTVTLGGLSSGLEIPSQGFMLITHKHINSDIKKPRKRPKNAQEIGSLDELKQGDYVVHEAHGIGIFDGINRITNGGVTKDYIKIKYAKSDVLYVPVTQLDLVSRYIGAATEDGAVKVHRLGGAEWQKTRKRVKADVKDMAKKLTALYA
ncbi:MAG: transcription-repair coupling factor, partial [Clostridia bacterium]|nr:transcription-repair coupling factor [Clostridia bacterium]